MTDLTRIYVVEYTSHGKQWANLFLDEDRARLFHRSMLATDTSTNVRVLVGDVLLDEPGDW